MNEKLKQTMKITRRPKVTTDDRGRTVWDGTVETANLELVSTQMLKQFIEADAEGTKDDLLDLAAGSDGLLAHDADKGRFEIISDEELQRILDGTDMQPAEKNVAGLIEEPVTEAVVEEEELELVSTQILRRILIPEDDEPNTESGFDPYDSG